MAKPYQYKKGRTPRPRLPAKGAVPQLKLPVPEREQLRPVQGKMPGSTEEYRLALALKKLRVDFEFQVPLRGGRRVKGGQVIDFVVYKPFPQPVQVEGAYWHRNQSLEKWKTAVIRQEFGRDPIVVQTNELTDQQAAYQVVVNKIL